jgi:hypothetical protein
MKFSRCVAAFVAVFCLVLSHKASAQTSVYGSAMLDAFGGTGDYYGNGEFKGNAAGFIVGAFYTFPSPSRFKAGVDGRITYSPGDKGGSAYTGALRVSFVPTHVRLRPYFQIGGGVVKTDLSTVTCDSYNCYGTVVHATSGAAQIVFGLDVRLTDHFDLRAIDYGADAGGSSGGPHAAAAFIDAGVIYHFHPTKRKQP